MLGSQVDRLTSGLGARVQRAGDPCVRRVSTDSRTVQPGDLFFALAGERFDGHDFVPQVLEQGAAGAVVRHGRAADSRLSPLASRLLEVDDPLTALGELGAWHRNRFSIPVVAVTGSVGKTTTKDMVAAVLRQQWETLKSPGNLNAEIGLPLTLLQLDKKHQAAVVEMAMR